MYEWRVFHIREPDGGRDPRCWLVPLTVPAGFWKHDVSRGQPYHSNTLSIDIRLFGS